jgi:hypothetical protein
VISAATLFRRIARIRQPTRSALIGSQQVTMVMSVRATDGRFGKSTSDIAHLTIESPSLRKAS